MELGTFLVNVYKRAVDNMVSDYTKASPITNNQVYYLEKTIISTFFKSEINANDEYITKMLRRLKLIRLTLQTDSLKLGFETVYLKHFINLCDEYIKTEKRVLPMGVLKILNIIYKRKGDILDIYRK